MERTRHPTSTSKLQYFRHLLGQPQYDSRDYVALPTLNFHREAVGGHLRLRHLQQLFALRRDLMSPYFWARSAIQFFFPTYRASAATSALCTSTPPSGKSAQESGFMKASQSISLVRSRAHSSAILQSEELVAKDWLRKGAKCAVGVGVLAVRR